MLVSVIIPTYKRSFRLAIAVDSVLNQTYKNIEIIVVDDNNDDQYKVQTRQELDEYISNKKIRYISHEINRGGCVARNTGGFEAKGNFIAFLDDDDFYEPNKIEEQLNFLNQNKSLDACICSMYRVDEDNISIVSRENDARGSTLKEALLDGNVFTSMIFIKRDLFIKLGGFSEIPRYQDRFFHLKFLLSGHKLGVLNKQLLTLVEHSETRISFTNAKNAVDSLNLLHKIEIENKELFDKKEWNRIKYRFYYEKAYNRATGNSIQKVKALLNMLQSLTYSPKYNEVIKLLIKISTPNFILKKITK